MSKRLLSSKRGQPSEPVLARISVYCSISCVNKECTEKKIIHKDSNPHKVKAVRLARNAIKNNLSHRLQNLSYRTAPDDVRQPTATILVSTCNTHFDHVHNIFMPVSWFLVLLQTVQHSNALQYTPSFMTSPKTAITHPCRQAGPAKSLTCFLSVIGLAWVIKGGGLKREKLCPLTPKLDQYFCSAQNRNNIREFSRKYRVEQREKQPGQNNFGKQAW